MKIFLSALEVDNSQSELARWQACGIRLRWNLMSYYYLRQKESLATYIRDNSDEILIDSGAHSFQKGKKVNWLEYTKQYAEFIRRFDRPHVVGFFEMDVDNIIGYDRVLQLRKILENVSDKIIPVWHKNRGVDDFKRMCQQYAGKVIAVTGFKNEDIRDDQYLIFVKYARLHGCRIHCLGMTRKAILDKVPFDYVDSSSWKQQSIYGRVMKQKRSVSKSFSKNNRHEVMRLNYAHCEDMQEHYFAKWHKECWRNERG
jgi:hypothetical protein